MTKETLISWTDLTWSPWYGCTQVSMGEKGACEGCYARHLSETRMKRVVFGGPGRGEGTRDVRADSAWAEPLRWNRTAPGSLVFPSMCDPFDNHPALREPRRRFFGLIRATPNLTWLLLTKRPGMIVKLFTETWKDLKAGEVAIDEWWPANAAIGCTVVTQEEADRDVPVLLAAKAALDPAFAFLSMEPLLGPVDLTEIEVHGGDSLIYPLKGTTDCVDHEGNDHPDVPRIDWVITGGETDQGKHKARPSDPAWFRSLRDQCAAAGVPFHFKQWGEWQEVVGAPPNALGRDFAGSFMQHLGKRNDPGTLDGVLHHARPFADPGRYPMGVVETLR